MVAKWWSRPSGLSETYDLIVVGAGPAGLATGLSASRLGLRTLILERTEWPNRPRVGEHLAPTARPLLRRLGLTLPSSSLDCPGVLALWETPEPRYSDYLFGVHGQGVHLVREDFDQALLAVALEAGCSVKFEQSVRRLRPAGGVTVVVTDKAEYRGRFLVDASGRSARFCDKRLCHDSLVGVVAQVQRVGQQSEHLLLEAGEKGWWYVAPQDRDRALAVWMTDADLLRQGGRTPHQEWTQQWQRSKLVRERVCQDAAGVKVVDARTSRAGRSVGPGRLGVGDAAISFDPLSSQGIEKGIRHGIQAARAIHDALAGHPQALVQYSAELEREFQRYLVSRQRFYSQVTRFSHSTFWSRRQSEQSAEGESDWWSQIEAMGEEYLRRLPSGEMNRPEC